MTGTSTNEVVVKNGESATNVVDGSVTQIKVRKPRPTHYKIICISIYTNDLAALEDKVAELKRRGHTKMNKSQLIRLALSQLDLDRVGVASQ